MDSHDRTREEHPRPGELQCQGPGVEMNLGYWEDSKKATVAVMERVRERSRT